MHLDAVVNDCYELMDSDAVSASNGPQTNHSTWKVKELPDNALGEALRGCWRLLRLVDDGGVIAANWLVVNATGFGGYNSLHVHGRSDLIGIYYPKYLT